MNVRMRWMRMTALSLLLGALILAVTSCAKKESTTTTSETSSSTMSEQSKPAISDANIAAIVVTANNADVDNGKQALLKSKNDNVKGFAEQMIKDHSSVNDKATALATRLSLTPVDNETSNGLKAQQDSIRTVLKGKSGAAFNRGYIDNEVSYHQAVLDALDQTLIPNAQNAELKQLLTDVRPVIAAHLEHAKQIQAGMSSTAAQ